MSIALVTTRGYGNGTVIGSISDVVTRGYSLVPPILDIDAITENIAVTGLTANVVTGIIVEAATESITATAIDADVSLDAVIDAVTASITATTFNADVGLVKQIDALIETIQATIFNAEIGFDPAINAQLESILVSGISARIITAISDNCFHTVVGTIDDSAVSVRGKIQGNGLGVNGRICN